MAEPQPRGRVRITGVGHHLPAHVMTNHDLERMVDTSDEWIVERSGIRERRIAAPHESSSSLGAEAARHALASAELEASDLDLVIVGTSTPDGMFPAAAARVQDAIGAKRAAAFDVNAACAGFIAALSTGSQFIASGAAERVLVVGTETMSRIVDWSDRGTCVLFGDGAGAVILERGREGVPGDVESVVMRSDGSLASLLYAGGPAAPSTADGMRLEARIVMEGPQVFRQAVGAMSQAALEALDRAGLAVGDLTLCVPHQANSRILDAVARQIGLAPERVYVNLDRYGNTSSASIPIALSEATEEGRLQPGDHLLLIAFGGGLSWGAIVVEWAGVRSARTALEAVAQSSAVGR